MTTQLPIPKERLETLSIRLNKFIVENEIPMGDELGKIVDDVFIFSGALLAAYEQEPVAYITYKGYLLHAGDPKVAQYSDPTPLYADPAPSIPAVPEERTWLFYCEKYPEMPMGDAIIRAVEWNSCRAAMLNGGKS